MLSTAPLLLQTDFPSLSRSVLDTLQVNLGLKCNQKCRHCHVNAGPSRTEMMDQKTRAQVVDFLSRYQVSRLDLTGGAPELNPGFRDLVREGVRLGVQVIDRCNLTILEEPGFEWLGDFLAEQRVEVVASLPCYLEDNVNRQRGSGVFKKSILGLQRLNKLGYGLPDSGLPLSLVFNPQGASLPPPQKELEADYRRYLREHFEIEFDQLFTLVNMPIQRFGNTLLKNGEFESYRTLLHEAHQEENLASVMCRSLISVDWRGYVYDCDFNQMLDIPLGGQPVHLSELRFESLNGSPIAIGDHCYACTAGQGSSCGGALQGT